jgi:hypothetical protein
LARFPDWALADSAVAIRREVLMMTLGRWESDARAKDD